MEQAPLIHRSSQVSKIFCSLLVKYRCVVGDISVVLSADEIEILQCLYTSDYDSFKALVPNHVQGTLIWFLKHKKYMDWRRNHCSFLWTSGHPGSGKSVLSSFLIDELQNSSTDTVCFFFFKDDNDQQQHAAFALCSILHQLFKAKPSLIRHAAVEFRAKRQKLTGEFRPLWNIFTAVVEEKDCGNITCVIDALDECQEPSRTLLMKSLASFCAQDNPHNNAVKFFVTSRPHFSIDRQFQNLPTMGLTEDETSGINGDIDLVIKSRVEGITSTRGLSTTMQADLEQNLIRKADQTFLWVSLILELIEESALASKHALYEIISSTPRQLDALYEKILQQSSNADYTRKLLHIIVAARRPLSVEEIGIAFVLRTDDRLEQELDYEPSMEVTIRRLCGLFVRIIDSKVYLVHQTAKEFLVRPSNSTYLNQECWKYALDPTVSNYILGSICITYLLFTVFESDPLAPTAYRNSKKKGAADDIDDQNSDASDYYDWAILREVQEYTGKHRFLDYAAKHWTDHFRLASSMQKELLSSATEILNTETRRFLTWFRVFWTTVDTMHQCPEDFPDLVLASYFGLETVVCSLLEKGAALQSKDSNGRTALHRASANGHVGLARFLLEKGADVSQVDEDKATPLHLASRSGQESAARLLLENGADICATDKFGRTALHLAVQQGHEAVVLMLLERGSDVNSNTGSHSPLHIAATRGDPRIVQALLKNCADVHIKSNGGKTPLHWASAYGHNAVVRCLIEEGADVNATGKGGEKLAVFYGPDAKDMIGVVHIGSDSDYEVHNGSDSDDEVHNEPNNEGNVQTPLQLASYYGHETTALILLDNGAKIDERDGSGRSALHYATMNSESDPEAVVRLLLAKGADPNAKDNIGKAPLLTAVNAGHEILVRLLLESGADLQSKGRYGETALLLAAQTGHDGIFKLLLEKNNNLGLEPKDRLGRTALLVAAWNGHKTIVKQLLESGADLELKDNMGRTALLWASEGGHEAVVELVLEKGAGVDSCDNNGWTALLTAAADGRETVVRLLLEKGADLESKGKDGQTALLRAAENGHEAIVKLLLTFECVNPNSKDNTGRTALFYAAVNGSERLTEWLLADKRVEPDLRDHYSSTPLSAAVIHGHQELVRLLLASQRVKLDSKDDFGRSPLWWARRNGYPHILRSLLDEAERRGIFVCISDLPVERIPMPDNERTRYCDVCTLWLEASLHYHCKLCNGGDFDICLECFKKGARCLEDRHVLEMWEDQKVET